MRVEQSRTSPIGDGASPLTFLWWCAVASARTLWVLGRKRTNKADFPFSLYFFYKKSRSIFVFLRSSPVAALVFKTRSLPSFVIFFSPPKPSTHNN